MMIVAKTFPKGSKHHDHSLYDPFYHKSSPPCQPWKQALEGAVSQNAELFVRVRGALKVLAHLMLGLIVVAVKGLCRLLS